MNCDVNSDAIYIKKSKVTQSHLLSKQCSIDRSTLFHSRITSDDLDLSRSYCFSTNFHSSNIKYFKLYFGYYAECLYNNQPLIYVETKNKSVYTDGITIWAGCWILKVDVVRRHINNPEKLLKIEQKSEIRNFKHYVLTVKYILDVLDLK